MICAQMIGRSEAGLLSGLRPLKPPKPLNLVWKAASDCKSLQTFVFNLCSIPDGGSLFTFCLAINDRIYHVVHPSLPHKFILYWASCHVTNHSLLKCDVWQVLYKASLYLQQSVLLLL